jgi:hypothetical protein
MTLNQFKHLYTYVGTKTTLTGAAFMFRDVRHFILFGANFDVTIDDSDEADDMLLEGKIIMSVLGCGLLKTAVQNSVTLSDLRHSLKHLSFLIYLIFEDRFLYT